jgi:exosortase/archaeosortase
MTTEPVKKGMSVRVKLALVSLATMLMGVGTVSAVTYPLNESVAPIIIAVTLLMTPILAVIVGIIPLLVTLAVCCEVFLNGVPQPVDRVHLGTSGSRPTKT